MRDQLGQVGGLGRDGHGWTQRLWRPRPSCQSRHRERHGPRQRWWPGSRRSANKCVIPVHTVDVALQYGLCVGASLRFCLQGLQGHPDPGP